MRFSIITVCRNSEKTIRRTFDSVLSQNCKDYEYIVIDGVSTDSTIDIIKEYEPRFQGRMRWISEPDNGIYDAMNKGIGTAKGELIAILNSDDFYAENALAIVSGVFDRNPDYDVYYGIISIGDENGNNRILYRTNHSMLAEGIMPSHPSTFLASSVYKKFGLFDTAYKLAADVDLFVRIFFNKGRFCPIDCVLSTCVPGGATQKNEYQSAKEVAHIMYHYGIINKQIYYKRIFKIKIKKIIKSLLNIKSWRRQKIK